MSDFRELLDLASERLGGAAVLCNDEFFAPMANLVKQEPARFEPDLYTDRGKWMDGWETRRRREPGHDWCIVRLGVPGRIRGVVVDTAHFKGNFPESFSLEGLSAEASADPKELAQRTTWTEIVPKTKLQGDSPNAFTVSAPLRFTHVRLNIFPDGGVARLRVHGDPLPRWGRVFADGGLVDLAAAEHGGRVVAASDMFFSSRHNLILPGPSRNMGDGWETRRRRGPGHDWVIVKLAGRGVLRVAEIDTMHFKGNAPGWASLEGCQADQDTPPESARWVPLLERTPLRPHALHTFRHEMAATGEVTHVRLNIFPDGGVARLRLRCHVSEEEQRRLGLAWLNALPEPELRDELRACCASTRWVEAVARRRPFSDFESLRAAADDAWAGAGEEDVREAIAGHPRIGERALRGRFSAAEQSGAAGADPAILDALVEKNRAYEERFGHIFLICATGKSAAEMLAALEQRMRNDPATELRVAAAEQGKITQLRLDKVLRQ